MPRFISAVHARHNSIVSLNMRIALLLVALFASNKLAVAAESIVLGTDRSQQIIEGVETPCVQDGELLCNGVWVRWEIRVSKTLSGPAISGRIKAAIVQHGRFVSSRKLFVLKPISDPELRKALDADYILEGFSSPHEMYCLGTKPEGIDDTSIYYGDSEGGGPYCFERPDSTK
jgi:hypothetical protein